MTKLSLLTGASVVALGLVFGSAAFASGVDFTSDPALGVGNATDGGHVTNSNGINAEAAGPQSATTGGEAGNSSTVLGDSNSGGSWDVQGNGDFSAGQGNATGSGNVAVNSNKSKSNFGAGNTNGGAAGNAIGGSAAGDGVAKGNNDVVGGFGNATGNDNNVTNKEKDIKAKDGSAITFGDGTTATALNAFGGGIVQVGSGDASKNTALTQSGVLNVAHDAQLNIADLKSKVSGINLFNVSGLAGSASGSEAKTHANSGSGAGNLSLTHAGSFGGAIGGAAAGAGAESSNGGDATAGAGALNVSLDVANADAKSEDKAKSKSSTDTDTSSSESTSQSTSGNTAFETGAISDSGVSIDSGARGIFALAGNTGVGASQNAIIHINSDIVGDNNLAFGGGGSTAP
ncbi:MAG: hypothetical protein WAW96_17810 [Alphaproteobacteria bacterium]